MFKKDFIFGVATSSFQIEGTHQKFKTLWDIDHTKIQDGANGHIACDHVHLYESDISLIKQLGVDAYRLSFSWARLQPTPDGFSKEGIQFYLNLLMSLKTQGIKVSATLYHWDMPLWLYEKGFGFDNLDFPSYFLTYAKQAFELFDDYVFQWTTINEPWCISMVGYFFGNHAPWIKDLNRAIRAQFVTLDAHQVVYHYYKKHFNKPMGIVLNLSHVYEASQSEEDLLAKSYADIFFNGMYLDPLFHGHYPERYLKRLDELQIDYSYITKEKCLNIKDSLDFLGINTYSHFIAAFDDTQPFLFKRAISAFPKTDMGWDVNPQGLFDLIVNLRKNYPMIPVFITENGSAFPDEIKRNRIKDRHRIDYLKSHLSVIEKLHETHHIDGYFAWSLMDNFEWAHGYHMRFGLVYVDFQTLKRTPKQSFKVYQKIIKKRTVK
ncbi:MAG: family 1 glycosylhydrolase [Acholeplasmataceae bacterium]